MKFALWPLSLFATTTALGIIWFAWPRLETFVVTVLMWAFGILMMVLTGCLIALAVGFTWWRIAAARADARIAESAATFASEAASPVQPMRSEKSAGLWLKAYLDFGWLAFTKDTMAFSQMRDYMTAENKWAVWKHMADEMKRAGFAAIVRAYGAGGRTFKVTRFIGSYRVFFRKLMHGDVELSPHSKHPAPVIRAEKPALETTKAPEASEATETTASRTGAVVIGN